MKSILLLGMVALSGTIALGHSCANIAGFSEKEFHSFLDQQSVIFFGEVIALDPPDNNTQRVSVKVLRSWKGIKDNETSLFYRGAYDPFEREIGGVGTQKVFYASTAKNGGLNISFCGFQGARLDDRMKSALGEGTQINARLNQTAQPQQSFWSWLWSAITSPFRG